MGWIPDQIIQVKNHLHIKSKVKQVKHKPYIVFKSISQQTAEAGQLTPSLLQTYPNIKTTLTHTHF